MHNVMVEVVPSLPAQSFHELVTKVGLVHQAVSRFQIDVADGMFVTNRSWPMNPGDAAQFERLVRGQEKLPFVDSLEYEVHLMAHNPEKILPHWVRAGVVRALFHIESKHDFDALRAIAQKEDIELGVTVKIGTPLERLDAYMHTIEWVQLMGIRSIGVQGQPFDAAVLPMIRDVRARYPSATIQIDGAVNEQTAPALVASGADILAPGSFVFESADPHVAVNTLRHV
jgi:ribulose-phosphate 3-epimerase